MLLLQFLFDQSDFFTSETRHIVPHYNKAGISKFCLESLIVYELLLLLQFALDHSDFLTTETRPISRVLPCNKAEIHLFFSCCWLWLPYGSKLSIHKAEHSDQ